MKQILFLAAMICGIAVFAGDIDINGSFKKGKGNLPTGWVQNKGKWAKPFGKVEILENAVKITNTEKTKRTDLYTTKQIPAKDGDKVKITVKLEGKGTAGIGIYTYGEKKWCGSAYKSTKLKAESTEVTVTVAVKNRVKGDKVLVNAKKIRVVLQAVNPNSEVTFESVKVEVIPAK